MRKSTFISYSKKDKNLVAPIVSLLRTQGEEVFLDSDSIAPGEKWEEAIYSAIERSNQLILIWCCHSGQSKWVRKEFEIGLELRKPIIPVLCCSYPSDSQVGAFQWVDLRKIVHHHCFEHPSKSPRRTDKGIGPIEIRMAESTINRSNSGFKGALLVLMILIALIALFSTFYLSSETIRKAALITSIVAILSVVVLYLLRDRNVMRTFESIDYEEPLSVQEVIGLAKKKLEMDPYYFYPQKMT